MNINNIITLQSTTGAKAKQEFIKNHSSEDSFCKFLYYALNPLMTYNVSEDTWRSRIPGAYQTNDYHDIFEICEMLSNRKGVDDYTINTICSFLRVREAEEQELYIKLLAKTLRLGVTAKTIKKNIPG